MSLMRLVAMAAARPQAVLIGMAGAPQSATTIPIPSGAQVGDYIVANFFSGRNIAGGSGTAFNTVTFGDAKIAHRKLEAGDLTTPITLSANSPSIVGVWRGPQSMSAQVSALSWSDPSEDQMPGFSKSDTCIGIVGVGVSDTSIIQFWRRGPEGGQFEHRSGASSTGLGFAMGSLTDVDGYVDGTSFPVGGGGVLSKTARIYELLSA